MTKRFILLAGAAAFLALSGFAANATSPGGYGGSGVWGGRRCDPRIDECGFRPPVYGHQDHHDHEDRPRPRRPRDCRYHTMQEPATGWGGHGGGGYGGACAQR